MGGSLSAKSTPGEGSVFYFTAVFGVGRGKDGPYREITKLYRKRALVVVENETTCRVIKQILNHWEMSVVIAHTGSAGMAALTSCSAPFDYVLFDNQVYDFDDATMNTFLKLAQQQPIKPTIIMIVSSASQRHSFKQHVNQGISVHLTKPITDYELLDALVKPFGITSHAHCVEPVDEGTLPPPEHAVSESPVEPRSPESEPVNQQLAEHPGDQTLDCNAEPAENGSANSHIACSSEHSQSNTSISTNNCSTQNHCGTPTPAVDAPPKKRILLAEDNAVNQRLAVKLLEKFGYQATVAENGRIAVDMSFRQDFDLILMDVQMPGISWSIHTRSWENFAQICFF
jgi:CheY-like chemotaxis protein